MILFAWRIFRLIVIVGGTVLFGAVMGILSAGWF